MTILAFLAILAFCTPVLLLLVGCCIIGFIRDPEAEGEPEEMEEAIVRGHGPVGPMWFKVWRKKRYYKPEGDQDFEDVDPVADGYHRGHE